VSYNRLVSASALPLRSTWKTGAAFLDSLVPEIPARFFHPVPPERALPPGGVGELMSVFISFEDREAEFHIHARIIDRREGTVKRGLTLEVIPEEQERMDVILVAARGESLPYRRRRHDRIPCAFACELLAPDGRRWRGTATNVNEGGLHAAIEDPMPEVGALVEAELQLGEDRKWQVRARVVEAIPAGPQKGVGMEFLFASVRQRDELWDAVGRLRRRSGPP
jgi:hypothetical protein